MASQSLSQLVQQVRRVTTELINPLPKSYQVAVLDNERMMQGLSCPEALSCYHPFGRIAEQLPKTGLAAGVNPLEESGVDLRADNADYQVTMDANFSVFKHSLTELVETVGSGISKSVTHHNEPLNRVLAGSGGKTDVSATVGDQAFLSAETPQETSREGATQIGSQLFQQLETLVKSWQFSEQVNYLITDKEQFSGENPLSLNALHDQNMAPLSEPPGMLSKEQLLVLTEQLLTPHRVSSKTQKKRAPGNRVLRTINNTTNDAQGSERQSRAVNAVTADNLKRTPNSNIQESVSMNAVVTGVPTNANLTLQGLQANGLKVNAMPSSIGELSTVATQKVADALNDYLQEQAELHGVDLS